MEFPKTDVGEVRIEGQKPVRVEGQGLPDAVEARQPNEGDFGRLFPAPGPENGENPDLSAAMREPIAYSAPARLSLGHDRPFPVPEHLFGAAGELFRPRGADPRRRPAADQAEPGAGGPARARSRPGWRARRAPRSSPASASPTAPSRSRWPMPATSSAISCRSSATAAPSCSAKSSTGDGVRRDIQLKGSGPTPFSRRGDGRAALGPVLREYIVSEAMAALGIPTTRSLAAVITGRARAARDACCPAPC